METKFNAYFVINNNFDKKVNIQSIYSVLIQQMPTTIVIDQNLYQDKLLFIKEYNNQSFKAYDQEHTINNLEQYEYIYIKPKTFAETINNIYQHAKQQNYTHFTILEIGTQLNTKYYTILSKYLPHITSEITTFIIAYCYNNKFLSLINDYAWVEHYCQELGFIDYENLKKNMSFLINGAVFNIAKIQNLEHQPNAIAKDIPITTQLELALRALTKHMKIFVIPFIGLEYHNNASQYLLNTSMIPHNISQLPPEQNGYSKEQINYYINLAISESLQ